MTGLLHRLAARAVGTAVVVRSDARLPYGAVGLESGDAPQAWVPEKVASGAAPASEAVQPSRSNVGRGKQDAQEGTLSGKPARVHLAAPDAIPFSREAPPVHRAHTATPAIEPVAAPGAPVTSRSVGPLQPMLPPAEPAAPVARLHESAAMPHEPPLRRARLSGEPARNESPRPPPRRAATAADPAPLLPAAPHRAVGARHEPAQRLPTPAPPQMSWPLASTASPADEGTAVHIHIGRIDVTAVHEAPKVRAKPGARSTALSLDAYLAARSKA